MTGDITEVFLMGDKDMVHDACTTVRQDGHYTSGRIREAVPGAEFSFNERRSLRPRPNENGLWYAVVVTGFYGNISGSSRLRKRA